MRFAVLAAVFFLAFAARAEDPQWVHAIAMHGSPKYSADFPHFDYVNPEAPKGGRVTLAEIGGYDSLNPFIPKGESAGGAGSIYDSLTIAAQDEAFTRYGLLAEAMRLPEDRSWIEFRLHADARWHDGQPVIAEDVKWTFETLLEKGQPFYRFYYGDVEKVTVLDKLTVRFDFKDGENRELPLIISELSILPKHYWADKDFEKTTLTPPLGSGAYRISKLEPNRSLTLERVEDYWAKDLPVHRGQDNFDVIHYEFYRDTPVAVEAFKSGAFDFRSENSSVTWATSYDIPEVEKGLLNKITVNHQQAQGMQGFAFNLRKPLFQDPKVRQALAYAFDFEWSNKNLFYGQYKRTRSYFDNSELAATGLPGPAELAILEPYRGRIPDQVFTTAYNPPATKGDGKIRSNLRMADTLLKEAGWVIRDKQRVNGEGTPLAFEIMLSSPLFERIVLPMKKNLERLGIAVEVRRVDSSQYVERWRKRDFEMIVHTVGQSLSPGNEQRGFWGTAAADQPSSRNIIGIKDPVIDELIELVISAPDRESLITRVKALDRVLQWGHYVIPNWHTPYQRILFWDKFGRPEPTKLRGTIFGTWWVDPDKVAALKKARGN
ncbi:extracellular solute-binding protein [Magnetospira sp. QH-2]|uniref:extracellular solute-binding protein n=1 Tax=Magnetospira sp. (strain QH-2) TaxID=1288970 RepID=UPI0003E80D8E|nr:extracellular solute-binding protein [Magnetospira sp. QH-2]CCQ72100.1 ABC transporter, periplasmic subunit [Magnetospira sp. QH-2]